VTTSEATNQELIVNRFQRFLPKLAAATFLCLFSGVAANAADEYGIFELIYQPSGSFDETLVAVRDALGESSLTVHSEHEVRVPDKAQSAHVFVLTSPEFKALAKDESPRTVSAQVLRVAVYTSGADQRTQINMANPVPHAMVFYAGSDNYDKLVAGARSAAGEIRTALSAIPGEAVSVPQEPMRKEKHYRKFKGDGPARMMAKFRTFQKSQLLIHEAAESDFAEVTATVTAALAASTPKNTEDPDDGWDKVTQISFGDNAVYVGVSNPYIEDRMIRINSRSRNDGESDKPTFPGVDHVAALPTEILILKVDGKTKVLHYGQMWRMQLYFWDSGYLAFTANVGVPSSISNSIKEFVAASLK
jgi:uncharacterized protein (DUF302 family)